MTFISQCHEVTDVIHLQCFGGVHFNLLRACPGFDEVPHKPPVECLNSIRLPEDQRTSIYDRKGTSSAEQLSSAELLKAQCTHDSRTQCSLTVVCNGVPLCGLLDTGTAVGLITASALRIVSTHDPEIPVQKTVFLSLAFAD